MKSSFEALNEFMLVLKLRKRDNAKSKKAAVALHLPIIAADTRQSVKRAARVVELLDRLELGVVCAAVERGLEVDLVAVRLVEVRAAAGRQRLEGRDERVRDRSLARDEGGEVGAAVGTLSRHVLVMGFSSSESSRWLNSRSHDGGEEGGAPGRVHRVGDGVGSAGDVDGEA
ncbi:FAD binding domain-containing protein [Colletotrichum scovillei]|uniref:FAD binding domain-containing protein n=1 Tax=Colletotrichum scovillei TaxID=1209932 RepID=A0A9P7R0Q1_9PEZI|nr:FAD binding domain-containing protein [Colletotrichum scovillei]KAG7059752.1 FAD binding domain-containing protein [Colletotrichum scovillei]KAG7067198.1 FAD binding domain-containing protein [Colletotrichum scovillei]